MSSNFHTPSKPLNPVSIRPPENTVKGAVELDPLMGQYLDVSWRYPAEDKGLQSTYSTFDKENDNLPEFISRLCETLRLPEYAPKRYGILCEASRAFLTEENRSQVQQGFLLVLTASPENYVRVLLSKLNATKSKSYQQEVSNTLQTLFKFSADITFAKVFHAEGGITNGLIPVIEKGTYAENADSLALVLQSFLQLMEHPDLVPWTALSPEFVKKISTYITGKSKVENNSILQASLSIIEQILATKDEDLTEVVKSEIPFESLIRHLEKSDERVLLNVLTLMVTLYNVADQTNQVAISQHLNDSPYRLAIEKTVLRESRTLDHYIQQQLAIIQRLQLNELGKIAQRKPLDQEIGHLKIMKELNGESLMTKSTTGSMSGSTSTEYPYVVDWDYFAELVQKTPPGLLAIDAILHCVEHHAEMLSQISIENKMRQNVNVWPFPIVAAHLVSVLIDLLDIVPSDAEHEHKLVVVLFNADKPFYELFAVSVYLFHRTWREMNASVEDIQQVVAVVAEQLERSFKKNPKTFKMLDEILLQLNYPKMQEIWKRERSEREEIELQSDAIKELRVLLRPSMENLVKMNKKNCLKNGETFIKVVRGKGIQKNLHYWYWKLDSNERILTFSDSKDGSEESKVKVEDIQRIVHGSEYQEMLQQVAGKSSKKTTAPARFGFCLEVADSPEPFNLATEDEQVYCDWIDGLSALISTAVTPMKFTESGEKQVERLLNFEIRTRLLEIETPPTSTLVIPELPTNFDWIPAVKMIDPNDDDDEVESLNGA